MVPLPRRRRGGLQPQNTHPFLKLCLCDFALGKATPEDRSELPCLVLRPGMSGGRVVF